MSVSVLYAQLHSLPKNDYHHHFFLGARSGRMREIFAWNFVEFPQFLSSFWNQNSRKMSSVTAITRINDWIRTEYVPLMRGENFLALTAQAVFEAARADHVKYLESSINVDFPGLLKLDVPEFLECLSEVRQCVAPDLCFGLDLGIRRTAEVESQFLWMRRFLEVRKDFESPLFRISGLDLYDVENTEEDEKFRKFYLLAGREGLKRKAHVGEFSSAETVQKTVEMFDLQEVQHGIHAGESRKIAKWLAKKEIRLNISPASNIMLDAINLMNEPISPLRVLYEEGVKLQLATDDLLLFNQSISEQGVWLVEQGIFSEVEIKNLI
ncbi:MAG: hypothetical protein Q4C96_11215 [Planctomycetia bacterium]|nr:hypothetical protein [Planctomycetia bacterium]